MRLRRIQMNRRLRAEQNTKMLQLIRGGNKGTHVHEIDIAYLSTRTYSYAQFYMQPHMFHTQYQYTTHHTPTLHIIHHSPTRKVRTLPWLRNFYARKITSCKKWLSWLAFLFPLSFHLFFFLLLFLSFSPFLSLSSSFYLYSNLSLSLSISLTHNASRLDTGLFRSEKKEHCGGGTEAGSCYDSMTL